ncbi:hypothetical protein EI16_09690 [Hydrogenovibrio marinus]|uniref:Uncharacterized protein n=2 Tax=Hydrogenovibrio marinus TaxID=28885 RepID=A0A066ZSQ1_HYDMR|nr:hypothetical protein EI16_09690 [Hydrogenovibrio marinus]
MEGGIVRIASNGTDSYDGSQATTTGLPATASIASQVAQSHKNQAAHLTEQAKTDSVASAMQLATAFGMVASHMTSAEMANSFDWKKGAASSKEVGENWEHSYAAAKDLLSKYGINDKQSIAKTATALAQGGIDTSKTLWGSVEEKIVGASVSAKWTDEKKAQFAKDLAHTQEQTSKGTTQDVQKQTVSDMQKALTDENFLTKAGVTGKDATDVKGSVDESRKLDKISQDTLKKAQSETEAYERLEQISKDKGFNLTAMMHTPEGRAMSRAFQQGDLPKAEKLVNKLFDQYKLSQGQTSVTKPKGYTDPAGEHKSNEHKLAADYAKQSAKLQQKGPSEQVGKNISTVQTAVGNALHPMVQKEKEVATKGQPTKNEVASNQSHAPKQTNLKDKVKEATNNGEGVSQNKALATSIVGKNSWEEAPTTPKDDSPKVAETPIETAQNLDASRNMMISNYEQAGYSKKEAAKLADEAMMNQQTAPPPAPQETPASREQRPQEPSKPTEVAAASNAGQYPGQTVRTEGEPEPQNNPREPISPRKT